MGLLGVVGHGDKRKAYDIVRALSTQILVSEVPEDLKVAFVYDSVNSKGWNKYESFTRTQMETGISLVAGTPEKEESIRHAGTGNRGKKGFEWSRRRKYETAVHSVYR